MGRKKLAMKQIEDKSKRLVTFSKRRSGLIKKANQLSVLCDVDIALLVFSSSGKLYKFSSSPDSLINLVKHYRNQLGEAEELEAVKITESCQSEIAAEQSHADLLKIVQRQVGGPAIDLLGVNDLMQLEKQLHSALDKVRSKKTQLMLDSLTALHQQLIQFHLFDLTNRRGIRKNSTGNSTRRLPC
ncbi:MADS-box protein FLOWERING LOCUS C-like isoform X2 [Punica granatum]|uniref:MADS-box protein FLOWERING LOCUS C-like isoform X2 n=1 Tax=Punica granatum TaxID=22663 RepID=A0A6P8DX12_PUNGR|nr:MADS-box protein FLOWERING LOCUS C-like isoform X2 [Punica granatum]